MSNYVVLETTWGAYLVHSDTCPFIDKDERQHCKDMTILTVENPKSGYDLAEQVRDALEIDQELSIYYKRFIFHSNTINKVDVCDAERLKKS